MWDEARCEVVVRFLDCPVCNIATGDTFFQALEATLQSRSIPWHNAIGFASDSASVMVGIRNSVLSRVRERQPKIFSLGCMCHLAALCATAALKKLPVSIDGLLINIYYHFKHSSKRCEEFAVVLQDFEGIAPLSVIKHSSSRWLSLEKAVRRLITLWPALLAYFDRDRGTNERARRVADALMDLETKLWCYFVAFALKPLNAFNISLQTSASKIGTVQHDISQLLRSYLANFIRPECLVNVPIEEIALLDIEQPCLEVPDTELAIGSATRLLLIEEQDSIEGTHREVVFFSGVRQCYREVVHKMIAKLPFDDRTIQDLTLLDPRKRLSVSSESVYRLSVQFLSMSSEEELDELQAEVRDYKSVPECQLPILDLSCASGIDHFWTQIASMTKPGDLQQKRFPQLAHLCKTLLVLPHSTADPERLFSMVWKIETDHRGSLLPSTVSSLLCVKLNTDQECYRSNELFTPKLLRSAKSATERSLSNHQPLS